MITGVHALIHTTEPEAARAFFRDVLGLKSVDAGEGWLIFALPPAELGIHPGEGPDRHELYLMCDDLDTTMADLNARGVEFVGGVTEVNWGRLATLQIPGGGELRLYQPKHPIAI